MGERDGEVTRVLKRVAATLGNGKFDEALRDLLHLSEKYPDAGEIRPQIAEVLLKRGESRARKGKVKEARDDFEQALGWSYASPDLYRAVWEAYMKLERFDRAHDLIMEGVERFPENDIVQAMAGDSFVFAKGDSGEARPYWEKALSLNPKNFGALFNLAAEAAGRSDRYASLGYLERCSALDLERTRKLWKDDMAS